MNVEFRPAILAGLIAGAIMEGPVYLQKGARAPGQAEHHSHLGAGGVVGALVHYTLAGPVVAILPSVDPETNEVGRHGFTYKNYGKLEVATSFVGHMAFGVLTAALYGVFHSAGGANVIV